MRRYLGLLGKVEEDEEFTLMGIVPNESYNAYYPYKISKTWYLNLIRSNDQNSENPALIFRYRKVSSSNKDIKIRMQVFDKSSKKWKNIILSSDRDKLYIKTEPDTSDKELAPSVITLKPSDENRPTDDLYAGLWYDIYFLNRRLRVSTSESYYGDTNYKRLEFIFVPKKIYMSDNNLCMSFGLDITMPRISRILRSRTNEPVVGSTSKILWTSKHSVTQTGSDCSKFISYKYGDECNGLSYNFCETGRCEYDDTGKSLKCLGEGKANPSEKPDNVFIESENDLKKEEVKKEIVKTTQTKKDTVNTKTKEPEKKDKSSLFDKIKQHKAASISVSVFVLILTIVIIYFIFR